MVLRGADTASSRLDLWRTKADDNFIINYSFLTLKKFKKNLVFFKIKLLKENTSGFFLRL